MSDKKPAVEYPHLRALGSAAWALLLEGQALAKDHKILLSAAASVLMFLLYLAVHYSLLPAIRDILLEREVGADARKALEEWKEIRPSVAVIPTLRQGIEEAKRSIEQEYGNANAAIEATRRLSLEELVGALRVMGKFDAVEGSSTRFSIYQVDSDAHVALQRALATRHPGQVPTPGPFLETRPGQMVPTPRPLGTKEGKLLVFGSAVGQSTACDLIELLIDEGRTADGPNQLYLKSIGWVAVATASSFQLGAFDIGVGYPKTSWNGRCARLEDNRLCPSISRDSFSAAFDGLDDDACAPTPTPTGARP